MSKKLFKIIFASVLLTLLIFFVSAIVFVAMEETALISAKLLIPPFLIAFLFSVILAVFICRYAYTALITPIVDLDFKNPNDRTVYRELKPLAKMLSKQNYELSSKTNELTIKENEFLSITANMSEGLVLINSHAMVISCNRSASEIFSVHEAAPYNVLSLCDSVGFRGAILAALGGGNGYDTLRKNDKFYEITVSPVFHNNNVEGAVIVVIDETEKEAREALRREFTSNISHELKTPLTSISGFAELISCGIASEDDAKKFAGKIGDEAKRLVSLVGDIIRLTQLDGREIPYDGEIGLLSTAQDVKEHLDNVAELSGVELSVSGEELFVPGNSTILFEMIYNLVDNGIKYNRPGGTVKIKVFTDDGAKAISVKDSGIGIPKDKQDRVFERFYRVDKSHSKEIGGTGLGLSIVKHSALYHGAKIELGSIPGVGTEITIKFPEVKH